MKNISILLFVAFIFAGCSSAPECEDPSSRMWCGSDREMRLGDDALGVSGVGLKVRPRAHGRVEVLHFFQVDGEHDHQLSIWNRDGKLLAREFAAANHKRGWRSVSLQVPVPVIADQIYVLSDHSEGQQFAVTPGFFAGVGLNRGPFVVLADGEDGPNGVVSVEANAFPSLPANGANFWIDATFAPADDDAPLLKIDAPAESATVGGLVTVSGTASDPAGIWKVEIQVDDGPVEWAVGAEAWSYSWYAGLLPNGAHSLKVSAVDGSGRVTTVVRRVDVLNTSRMALVQAPTVTQSTVAAPEAFELSASWKNMGVSFAALAETAVGAWAPGAPLSGPPTRVLLSSVPGPLAAGAVYELRGTAAFSNFDALGEWRLSAGIREAGGGWVWEGATTLVLVHKVSLGTALLASRVFDPGEPIYQERFLGTFDGLTPEFELKIASTQPQQGQFNFATTDKMVEFAETHGKQVRGHTLIWHQSLPTWITGNTWTRDQAIEILETHVKTVVGRYKGRIRVWDVVNEAVMDDGSWRPSFWLNTIGPEFVDIAFRAAHAADPDAILVYNDYSAERIGTKSNAIFDLLTQLKARGVPVHGFGLQAHLSLNFAPTQAQLQANLARFAAAGFLTEFTELDVRTSEPAGLTVEERLILQRDVYRQVAAACQAEPACMRVTTWGLTDKYSWAGAQEIPLPYDVSYAAKPALEALRSALLR